MIKKTKEYDMFVFVSDNRAKIDHGHVNTIVESIKQRNLLEYRPIEVNGKMEILDGQHRLLAAKALGVEIYYDVKENINRKDMICLNISKSWTSSDFLNYYVRNDYEEYKKLNAFIIKNSLTIKVAMNLSMGACGYNYQKFKMGEYVFNDEGITEHLDICWDTINYIKKMNGFSAYTGSVRFWRALIILVRHVNFELDKWVTNLSRMVERFGPRARTDDYLALLMEVFNWKNAKKVTLTED